MSDLEIKAYSTKSGHTDSIFKRRMLEKILFISAMLLVLLQTLVSGHEPARGGRMAALVIGNAAYKESPLKNTINDAKDIAAALKQLGYEVTMITDVDQRQMKEAIWKFGNSIKGASAALFYFSGHGMQLNGENFLIPVNAHIESEKEAEVEAVVAGRVLAEMEDAGTEVNILILDACRSNPYSRSRDGQHGLAAMDAPKGSIIAFATGPGKTASDGGGKNGIYTSALLKYLTAQKRKIEDVFKLVRKDVIKWTSGKQVPWESSSLIGDFYFGINGGIESHENETNQVPAQPQESGKNFNIDMVFVQGGWFQMGGSPLDPSSQHNVRVDDFYIGRFELTQKEWKEIMGYRQSKFYGDNLPVDSVSWYDAQQFIKRLNALTGRRFRLPTEAEWEYAARGGSNSSGNLWSGSSSRLDNVAWYKNNAGGKTHPAGRLSPNELGLYDMSGNVYEWCSDWYDDYYYILSAENNPKGPASGITKVIKGGSWFDPADGCTVYTRGGSDPGRQDSNVGFRLAEDK